MAYILESSRNPLGVLRKNGRVENVSIGVGHFVTLHGKENKPILLTGEMFK